MGSVSILGLLSTLDHCSGANCELCCSSSSPPQIGVEYGLDVDVALARPQGVL